MCGCGWRNLQFVCFNHHLFFHSTWESWIWWPWHRRNRWRRIAEAPRNRNKYVDVVIRIRNVLSAPFADYAFRSELPAKISHKNEPQWDGRQEAAHSIGSSASEIGWSHYLCTNVRGWKSGKKKRKRTNQTISWVFLFFFLRIVGEKWEYRVSRDPLSVGTLPFGRQTIQRCLRSSVLYLPWSGMYGWCVCGVHASVNM